MAVEITRLDLSAADLRRDAARSQASEGGEPDVGNRAGVGRPHAGRCGAELRHGPADLARLGPQLQRERGEGPLEPGAPQWPEASAVRNFKRLWSPAGSRPVQTWRRRSRPPFKLTAPARLLCQAVTGRPGDADDHAARELGRAAHPAAFPNSERAQGLGSSSLNWERTKCSLRRKGTVQSNTVLQVVPFDDRRAVRRHPLAHPHRRKRHKPTRYGRLRHARAVRGWNVALG